MNTSRPAAFVRRYGLYLLATVLLMLKTYIFYSQIHLKGFEIAFCIATLGILTLTCGLLRCISASAAKIGFVVLYFLAGFFMGVDSVYYAYVVKLPSIAQIGMVGQLDDISEPISRLINWKHMAMILDFPLWYLLFLKR